MAEDFCDENVLGHVFGFKAVAADGGVGASQVAGLVGRGSRRRQKVRWQLRADGGVNGLGGRGALLIVR